MHLFDGDIALLERGENGFTGSLSANWSINGIPNGGYLMAFIASAMARVSGKPALALITASYLSRCAPGETTVAVERFSLTNRFERLQAGLFQEGVEKVRAIGTYSLGQADCPAESYETGPPQVASRQACVPVPPLPNYSLLANVSILLDPASAGWMSGTTAGRSEQRGWIAFAEQRPHDIFSILLFADSFPPPIFVSRGMVGWVPTIELSINLRKMPETRWLKFSLRTRFITCGMVEEDGEIWDEKGNLVSISRQIAQFRQNDR